MTPFNSFVVSVLTCSEIDTNIDEEMLARFLDSWNSDTELRRKFETMPDTVKAVTISHLQDV